MKTAKTLPIGTKIYNHGDMANEPHFGTVVGWILDNPWGRCTGYTIVLEDGSRYGISIAQISPIFKGHSGTRIVTAEEYKRFRGEASKRLTPRKIGPFHDYHDAYDAAVEDSRRYGCDVGIEKLNGEFRVFFLPNPKNRCGFELRCEVVTKDSPRVERQAK